MKKLLKVCMILLTCCMANVFVCGTTNDISIVCAKDYGIENPKYRKGNTIWDTIYFGYYYQSQYDDKKEPIRWKVLSVNAIKNIDKKATIKVPKKQLRKYEKLFKSKTGYKKTMKIKK